MVETFVVELEGIAGASKCGEDERVMASLERAQGAGQLKGLPRRLPVGCRRGGCGLCRARVLKGTFKHGPMSRAHVSEEDEANGVILACAIYPLSDLLLRLETPAPRLDLDRFKSRSSDQGGWK